MQPLEILVFIKDLPVLFPKGIIALKERNLMLLIQAMMLLVIVPVYIMTFIFSWVYRADNEKSKYDPHLVDNTVAEVIWWGLPTVMLIIISIITWYKTHELDPYRPIESDKEALKIQVVALEWKWLFIYPEEKIATVNYLHIPKDRPVHFYITADAPMNTFWIPALGGQIYAMPGMQTELYLIANEEGTFPGRSGNISGEGFSWMVFDTVASSETAHEEWVQTMQKSKDTLDLNSYSKLAEPSIDHPIEKFRLGGKHVYHNILMKFMKPSVNSKSE
jgi:cytochrome o ubiquinol oxidase subunit 2